MSRAAERMKFKEVEIYVATAETDKALLCIIHDNDGKEIEKWIPFSVMADADASSHGIGDEDFVLRVHEWYFDKELGRGFEKKGA